MTISKIGAVLFLGTLAAACASTEEETIAGEAELRTNVTDHTAGQCTATQCIEVVATERLLYLSVEGDDCDGATIWDFGLERLDADGNFSPMNIGPGWGLSDASCIGKSENMWHYHGLDRGTYRVCATFHDTLSPGAFTVYVKSASGLCESEPLVGTCSYCDDDGMGGFDPGSGGGEPTGAGGGETTGAGGSGGGDEHVGGEGGCDE